MTNHEALMRRAMHMASTARIHARPNPWVGAVLVSVDGQSFEGATYPPGGPHAEIVAITAAHNAGCDTSGATLYTTLEPCSHTGRTGPCTEAIINAGISTVVSGITDPDTRVAGNGFRVITNAGIAVVEGICADEISEQLTAYIHHRRTGRPYVMLKMACTLDARTTLPDGERWITGETARTRVHELRAFSDAIVVGAGTVLADNPALTVRDAKGPSPRRIVLSRHTDIAQDAAVQPCTVWRSDIESLLDELGRDGILQLMVEGGPRVATAFHEQHLIDEYVFHIAPIVSGHESALGIFEGNALLPLEKFSIVSTQALGDDVEIIMKPIKQKVGAS